MLKESSKLNQKDQERIGLQLLSSDLKDVKMIGETIDTIHYADGRVEIIHGHNLVVSTFLNLVMCLLKGQGGYSGIQYWAVGSGLDSWDASIPNPDISANKLTTELGRVPISAGDIKFLDNMFNETETPTNIIQITHVFGVSDCNGIWREFGIFGGNATSTANSGIMINKRHHAIITKTNEMVVERVMRFIISLV